MQVVVRVAELNVGTEQQPIRAGLTKGHPDTPGVHNPQPSDCSLERHVRMAAYDHVSVNALEHGSHQRLGSDFGEQLILIAWSRVAEEHAAEFHDVHRDRLRPTGKNRACATSQLP